jgi:hypothetical protein
VTGTVGVVIGSVEFTTTGEVLFSVVWVELVVVEFVPALPFSVGGILAASTALAEHGIFSLIGPSDPIFVAVDVPKNPANWSVFVKTAF